MLSPRAEELKIDVDRADTEAKKKHERHIVTEEYTLREINAEERDYLFSLLEDDDTRS